MADATQKKKRVVGERKPKPTYLITRAPVDIVKITKNPLDIVSAMSNGEQVHFVDITTYMPAPAKRAKAA